MINSVSFGSKAGVFDKPNLGRQQTYTRPAAGAQAAFAPEAPKKKGKLGKTLLKIGLAAAAVAGLLVAGNKTNVLKNLGKYIPESIKNASWLQFAKEPVKTAAGAMDKAGGTIADYAVKGFEAVKGLFKKSPTA